MVAVTPLKEQISKKRSDIRAAHQNGTRGQEISSALATLAEDIIAQLYRTALGELETNVRHQLSERISLVALGGFGRGEMSPHSDIDLMFLYRGKPADSAQEFSSALLRRLWDVGFQVGHSVRTIDDCIALGKADDPAKTALMESRFLIGSAPLFRAFHEQFEKRVVDHRVDEFLLSKIKERYQEYDRYGTSVYMLEPDIKRSKGGLRDLHIIQWAALVRYSIATLDDLHHKAFLSSKDFHALTQAREFLWRVRAELHFHAGSAQDILTFDEQIRLAEQFGFADEPHLLGVERFMQQYYRHTTAVADISARFVTRCRSVSVWDRLSGLLPSRRPERGFLITNRRLTIDPAFRGEVMSSGTRLMRLFFLSVRENISIADELLEELHVQIDGMTQDQFSDPSISEMFLYILAGPHKIIAVLDLMHRVHLLEKIIPAFGWARGLMQFNQYHKYTVDEHTLRAVACAEAFAKDSREPKERSDFSQVYQDIRRKDLLHLALLLHDLGKGRKGDHSLIGADLAREASQRLGLDDRETSL
ncbi:MAG TPA: HD domain-containing protein, partial [Nitrospirales bacterium]|nr:HD domain-containing protein [Nitrospirales bacterium]